MDKKPMKISIRLLIITGIFLVLTCTIIVVLVNYTMRQQALVEAESKMSIMAEQYLAIHNYFSQKLKPAIFELTDGIRSKTYFDPVWMSSTYAIREINKYIKKSKGETEYYLKDAAINARSPENEATPYEKEFLSELGVNPKLKEKDSVQMIDGRPYLVFLRRGEVMEASCLRCHSSPDKAPADMVRFYGPKRSFNRKMGDWVQAISIRVPLAEAYANANHFSLKLSVFLLILIFVLFGILYLFSRRLMFAPLAMIHEKALQISTDEKKLGDEIPLPSGRELNELASAFNSMSKSLRYHMDNLEALVKKRTSELTKANENLKIEISARKKSEEELLESEERYRSMMESMKDPACICSPDFRVEYMNPAMVRRTGRDATGENCFKALHDLEEKCPWCMHDKAQQDKYIEFEIVSPKDNRSYYISQSPVAHGDGSVSKLTIFRDITEIRKTEAQLHRAQKMEAMGLLAGGVAHDLNNILSGIVSYPELLLLDLPEDSPLRKPIKVIQESGMRAADVVEDLLTIARGVATGKEALNVNTIVTEYLESPEYQTLEKTHSFVNLKTELDPELLNMSGSLTHIKKTLMNLVVNASEAIEGAGTVTISTMSRYLDEPLKGYEDVRAGEYAVLSVSDDGSGITPKDLERIFEPFYTKKVMGRSGTGLGLAVVWNTVQDHNGYINVNTSKKGTVFELYFPVTREEVAVEGEEVPLEDYLGHGEKILVVDDEERQRMIASGMLTKLGYTAEAASSGEEAIEYMKENAADLIVLDMVMPKGMNGRETYQQIIKIRPGQKAVIASGYAKTKEVDIAQELGAGKYIKKPYTLEKIGVAVKKELEK